MYGARERAAARGEVRGVSRSRAVYVYTYIYMYKKKRFCYQDELMDQMWEVSGRGKSRTTS